MSIRRSFWWRSTLLFALALAGLTFIVGPSITHAASCTVGSGSYPTIQSAVNDTSCSTITVPAGTYIEHVTIGRDVSIQGATNGTTVVDGNDDGTVITITAGSTVALENLTIQRGRDSSDLYGAGIQNEGTLMLTNSIVTNNIGRDYGGIVNEGRLTLMNSTVRDNFSYTYGGGIVNFGVMILTNSTVSGNRSFVKGGGIENYDNAATATLINSTVSNNSAEYYGGGIENEGRLTLTNSTVSNNNARYHGGGIDNYYIVTLTNSIVAHSTGGDCNSDYGTVNSRNSLIEDTTNACGLTNGTDGNIIGQDPQLGPLQDNGGSTQTQALQAGSPAIDAASAPDCPATDQRGVARPQGAGCDIGAYELYVQPTATTTAMATATLVPTSTPTNTSTPTQTPSNTPTASATATNTTTSTATPSNTPTASATATNTTTSTATPSNTPTASATATNTATATQTPSSTPTASATATNTPTASATATNTPTASATATNTATATQTPSNTPTASATATNTATSTTTPSNTPTASATATNTAIATRTSTPTSLPTRTATATVTTTPTPTATAQPLQSTVTPVADSYVQKSDSSKNFGSSRDLIVDGSDDTRNAYIRFTVGPLAGKVTHATLRLYVATNGTKDGPKLYRAANDSWGETTITWKNQPGTTGPVLGNLGVIGTNQWVQYDVTASVTNSGTYSFVLVGDGTDSVSFLSKESSTPPQLVLTVQP